MQRRGWDLGRAAAAVATGWPSVDLLDVVEELLAARTGSYTIAEVRLDVEESLATLATATIECGRCGWSTDYTTDTVTDAAAVIAAAAKFHLRDDDTVAVEGLARRQLHLYVAACEGARVSPRLDDAASTPAATS